MLIPKLNVKSSIFVLLMVKEALPSTHSSVPTELFSTKTTLSVIGGSTLTVQKPKASTASMTTLLLNVMLWLVPMMKLKAPMEPLKKHPKTLTTTAQRPLPITLMTTTPLRSPKLPQPPTTELPEARTLLQLTQFCPPKCRLWELTKAKNPVKPAASEAVEAVPAAMVDETMAEETTDEEAAGKDVTNAKAVASAVKLQLNSAVIEAAYLFKPMTNSGY